MSEESREIVPAEASPTSLWDGAISGQSWTSIPQDTLAGRIQLQACFGEPTLKTEDCYNQSFLVENLVIYTADSTDEATGEVRTYLRTAVVMVDGKFMVLASLVALKTLKRLAMSFGMPPWKGGLPVVFRQRPTRDAKRLYLFELDPRALEILNERERAEKTTARKGK